MNNEISELYELFLKVKQKGFHKSLRNGPTGLGYTFETLIGKAEDRKYMPDFKGIEIKTKRGYTKSPLTLFCLSPKKNDKICVEEILLRYGYPSKNNKKLKSFGCNVSYVNDDLIANKYYFRLKLNLKEQKLKLFIYDFNYNILENEIFWSFKELKERLYTKLQVLALVRGYPYKFDNETYYKYTNIDFYRLKGFYVFLKLIKENKILITFNIGMSSSATNFGKIHDRGSAFRISVDCIDELFEPVNSKLYKKTTY